MRNTGLDEAQAGIKIQFSSVTQSCPTLCYLINCSTPGLPVHHQLPEFESVMPSSHLILCRPLFLLPSIPPSIRVSSNESTLRMRWPKYWSFSFSISPSKERPGLISSRMDWLDLFAVQGTLKSSPTPQFQSINSLALSFLHSSTLTSIHDHWKTIALTRQNFGWVVNPSKLEYSVSNWYPILLQENKTQLRFTLWR